MRAAGRVLGVLLASRETAMTLRPVSTPPSRGSSSSWTWKGIVGVLAVVVGIPSCLVATCDLSDRASKPDVEVPVEPAPAEPAPVEPAPAEPAPVEPPADPLEVDAVSLVGLYNSGNEIAANDQVLGRLLRVRGEVGGVLDGRSPTVFLLGPEDEVDSVLCRLDVDQRSLARELTPGKVVTVIGTGAGADFGNPRLEGCRIISW